MKKQLVSSKVKNGCHTTTRQGCGPVAQAGLTGELCMFVSTWTHHILYHKNTLYLYNAQHRTRCICIIPLHLHCVCVCMRARVCVVCAAWPMQLQDDMAAVLTGDFVQVLHIVTNMPTAKGWGK